MEALDVETSIAEGEQALQALSTDVAQPTVFPGPAADHPVARAPIGPIATAAPAGPPAAPGAAPSTPGGGRAGAVAAVLNGDPGRRALVDRALEEPALRSLLELFGGEIVEIEPV